MLICDLFGRITLLPRTTIFDLKNLQGTFFTAHKSQPKKSNYFYIHLKYLTKISTKEANWRMQYEIPPWV